MSECVERRLVAILAADVAGYSRLMGATRKARWRGSRRIRKTSLTPRSPGIVAASSRRPATACWSSSPAPSMQCAAPSRSSAAWPTQNADVPQDHRIEFRIGINVGDIIIDDNDIFGDGVNIAARLEGIAEPGGICISDDAYRQIRGKIDDPLRGYGRAER